ncbi:putative uncharacterized protein DDB_G0294196 [Bombyx mandarina]|uniref:Uncharacterized protein n=1 Tax=Bombyx mandarina TaxID=7092 RepID=A0A6J2J7Y5_BOMMA|nr:putative uncharacterized protein DDB_G0294196 [Bombyx mandarina]
MDLIKEMLQTLAEHAVSYRAGQTTLRYIDRALWVVEKCARWAVPPPLDQDERPQPELIRPLPWVFFLMMLIALRITRETISLANLIMGKPPLRSADVVMYIQSKRRYLRTLKYQGNRMMRARTSTASQPRDTWYSGIRSMFEFTMCFRRHSLSYNNNPGNASSNDEVLVVKRSKHAREDSNPAAATSVESTMERLIEKMMVDLNAESDEDSGYTLTNATSPSAESDRDTICGNETTQNKSDGDGQNSEEIKFTPSENKSSTPEKANEAQDVKAADDNKQMSAEKTNNTSQTNTKSTQQTVVKDKNNEKTNVTAESKLNSKNNSDVPKTVTPKGKEQTKPDDDKPKQAEKKPEKDLKENEKFNTESDKPENSVNDSPRSIDNEQSKQEPTKTVTKEKEPTKIPTKNQTKIDDQTNSSTKNNEQTTMPTKSISSQEQTKTSKKGKGIYKNTSTDSFGIQEEDKVKSPEEEALSAFVYPETSTSIQESLNFLQYEKGQNRTYRITKTEKIVNGRTAKSAASKKKGGQNERRDSDVHASRVTPESTSL